MGESLGFGKDGGADGEVVEVGVDVGEDGADGEGVGGGGFSFWFRIGGGAGGGHDWLLSLLVLLLFLEKKGRGVQLGCRIDRFVRDG